jgi:malate synthase
VTGAAKLPWYVDLLNITLGTHDLTEARRRIDRLKRAFEGDGRRITENLDFG